MKKDCKLYSWKNELINELINEQINELIKTDAVTDRKRYYDPNHDPNHELNRDTDNYAVTWLCFYSVIFSRFVSGNLSGKFSGKTCKVSSELSVRLMKTRVRNLKLKRNYLLKIKRNKNRKSRLEFFPSGIWKTCANLSLRIYPALCSLIRFSAIRLRLSWL